MCFIYFTIASEFNISYRYKYYFIFVTILLHVMLDAAKHIFFSAGCKQGTVYLLRVQPALLVKYLAMVTDYCIGSSVV